MLLRRLMAALGPLLVCIGLCAVLRLLDGALGAGQFLTFALKGLLLGAALALTLPLAGVKARTTGLTVRRRGPVAGRADLSVFGNHGSCA